MLPELNPDRALIFRITHLDNLAWVLDHGLHCKTSKILDPNYVSIGNPDLIDMRGRHQVRCSLGGTLSDYVPFYFTPLSVMFFNIKTGWRGLRQRDNNEIVILVSSIHRLQERSIAFVFSDRHAVLAAAQFFSESEHLTEIDWGILQGRDFSRDPEDPRKVERYEAETLVHRHLPVDALCCIACHSKSVENRVQALVDARGLKTRVITKPTWYF